MQPRVISTDLTSSGRGSRMFRSALALPLKHLLLMANNPSDDAFITVLLLRLVLAGQHYAIELDFQHFIDACIHTSSS